MAIIGKWLQVSYVRGEGGFLLSMSGRSSWRQWLGWAVPNVVGLSPVSAQNWRTAATFPAAVGRG